MTELAVHLATDSYRVRIEPGSLPSLGEEVRTVAPHQKACLVVDAKIADSHGRAGRESLESAGFTVTTVTMEATESEKNLATVGRIYDAMLGGRLERASPVIALGGGIVGDTAGFAAATFLRGVPLIHAPTTLLAMVDATLGGKTGVNIPLPDSNALGKNLVGAFWQPRLVLADPLVLESLDARDFRCGLAECIKQGLIGSSELIELIESNAAAITRRDTDALSELIARSAAIKIAIVEADERETGRRALLNLGHTFAHAIEALDADHVRHGEAVAIGLCAAMACAREVLAFEAQAVERITSLLTQLGLPTALPTAMDCDALMHAMRFDKKVRDGKLRLILPETIGSCEIVEGVDRDLIVSAWREVGAR